MKIQNLGLRFAAVLLAVALFLHVRTEAREDRLLDIPLRWKNLPAGLVLKDPVPETVEVKVRANGKQFLKFQFGRPEVVIDLNDVGPGTTFTRLLTPGDVESPSNVDAEVVEVVRPRTVALEVDEKVEKEIRILPVVTSSPARGHTVRGQPESTPAFTTAEGPRTVLDRIDFIRTRPIDLQSLDQAAEFDAELESPPPE
jgi:YbbR domain-containing protein